MSIRSGDAEFLEEHVRHGGVIVLPGVDQPGSDGGGLLFEFAKDRRDLHEVRPCADDQHQAKGADHHDLDIWTEPGGMEPTAFRTLPSRRAGAWRPSTTRRRLRAVDPARR